MTPAARRTLSGCVVIAASQFLLQWLWGGANGWQAAGVAAMFAGYYLIFDYAFRRMSELGVKVEQRRRVNVMALVAVAVVCGVFLYVKLRDMPSGLERDEVVRVGGFLMAVLYNFIVPVRLFR